MQKFLVGVCLLFSIASAATVSAQCVDPALLQRQWQVLEMSEVLPAFQNNPAQLRNESLVLVKQLEAGEKLLQHVLANNPTSMTGMLQIRASGSLIYALTAKQLQEPVIVNLQMLGRWTLECDTMIAHMTKVDYLNVTLNEQNVPVGERAEMQKMVDQMQQSFLAEVENDPKFKEPQPSKVLFLGKTFALLEDQEDNQAHLTLFIRQQ